MTSCKLWNSSIGSGGYGNVWKDGRVRSAHRVAYEEDVGPIPEGMVIMHTCDTPACVNIDHLKLATQQENVIDMHNKGRAPDRRGEKGSAAKLTEDDVRAIRKDPRSCVALAAVYGVGKSTINYARNGTTWSHL